ncbi:hypothetical protein [Winogradskyella sp. MH6]|uniref:hypothetical protein n=1 Tax=Winogradskyella sp. MH6 TaxID=2929510 RepID=UPI001FB32DB6|nr:hypothetical protein [Winogradskyella sp. MH6]
MGNQSVAVSITINAEDMHRDRTNFLKYIDFKDNIPSDGYDVPGDKTSFDSVADANTLISWNISDASGREHLALITNIEFKDAPEGFFEKPPYDVGDGSWVAVLGDNNTDHNLVAKYSITFDSGYRGDELFTIDPKLQIKKRD